MNKGVVTKIYPIDEMPRDNNGKPFEIIINPTGIISRKNSGQLIELYQGRIIAHVNMLIKNLINDKNYNGVLKEILKMNQLINNDKKYVKQLTDNLKKISKDSIALERFIKSIPESGLPLIINPIKKHKINDIVNAMNVYGLKTKDKIYDPAIGSKTKTKVTYGYMYWSKAEHMSEFKYHARSKGIVKSDTGQAVQGSKNEGGQRVSELDMFALLGYEVNNYITEIISLSSDNIQAKNEALNKIYTQGSVSLQELKDVKSSTSTQLHALLKGMGVVE